MDLGSRESEEDAPACAEFGLRSGTVLNGIYRIDRFLTRGGMGDVYAGSNVETEELVAIKVMLPRLAFDPKILTLFRSEARILIRVAHPAVAQYRVFARDAALGVHYLVTDFIDGDALSTRLRGDVPGPGDVARLMRRLAGGLRVTHELGAVHRDMSPDNILLPGGRIDDAKIIDFGIAKYVEPDDRTVVIEGFAGKLGYVAPEQFGLFGNRIGPWTDIYSTALVLLAFARSEPIDMGRTMAEAIERRADVPDISALPECLHPAFRAMLQPDPANRPASMDAVVGALDPAPVVRGKPPVEPPAEPAVTVKPQDGGAARPIWRINMPIVASLAVALVAAPALWLIGHPDTSRPRPPTPLPGPRAVPPQRSLPSGASSKSTSGIGPPLSIAATAAVYGRSRDASSCRSTHGVSATATIAGIAPPRIATLLFVAPSGRPRAIVSGDAQQWSRSAKRRVIHRAGSGGYGARLCATEMGSAVFALIDGASAVPLLPGSSAGDTLERYRELAVRRGWPVTVAWLTLAPTRQPPSVAATTPTAVTTAAVATIPVPAARIETPRATMAWPAQAFCRRYRDGRWRDIGMRGRDGCIKAALKHDGAVYAQYGTALLRRYGRNIDAQANRKWIPLDGRTDSRSAARLR